MAKKNQSGPNMVDNTMTISYVNKMGGKKHILQKEANKIWKIAIAIFRPPTYLEYKT